MVFHDNFMTQSTLLVDQIRGSSLTHISWSRSEKLLSSRPGAFGPTRYTLTALQCLGSGKTAGRQERVVIVLSGACRRDLKHYDEWRPGVIPKPGLCHIPR
jgi:hypothetical protein